MLERLFGYFGYKRSLENPNVSLMDPGAADDLGITGGTSSAGVHVNRESALKYDAVWRAVNLIASSVAKIPLKTFKRSEKHWECDTSHPAYQMLRRGPVPGMTSRVFRMTLTAHAVLHGAGYAFIYRDKTGKPLELWPLSPDSVLPVRIHENGMRPQLKYIVTIGTERRIVNPYDMLCIMGLSYDGWVPYSVFDKARDSIGLGLGASKYTGKFFSNSAEPRVIIEVPAGGQWRTEAQQEFLRQWNSMHQGLDNSHRTAILTGGATAKPLSISATDAQLLETRKFTILEIANWFGVPPHKLGDSSKTAYNSLEQENQSFLDDGLETWLLAWEEECEAKLLTEDEKEQETVKVEFQRRTLIRPPFAQRLQAYGYAINARVMSPNECRAEEGLPPYEGGDEFLVPANIGKPGGNPTLSDEGNGGKGSGDGMEPANPASDMPEEPETEEPQANSQAILAAHRQLLVDSFRRAAKRLCTHARKAAGKPDSFMDWLDSFQHDHRSVIVDMLSPAIEAVRCVAGGSEDSHTTVDGLLSRMTDAFLEISGTSKPAELSQRVAEYCDEIERTSPETAADGYITRISTLTPKGGKQ